MGWTFPMSSTIPDVSMLSTCEWFNILSTNDCPFWNPYAVTCPPWFSPSLGPLLLKITKLGWLSWSERRSHARVWSMCHCISWRSWVQFLYWAFFFVGIMLAQHWVTSSLSPPPPFEKQTTSRDMWQLWQVPLSGLTMYILNLITYKKLWKC